MSTKPMKTQQDRFPHCVRLDLCIDEDRSDQPTLTLDLSFGDQWIKLPLSRFWFLNKDYKFRFELLRAELQLHLANLKSPPHLRAFRQSLPTRQPLKRTAKSRHQQIEKSHSGSSIAAKVSPSEVGLTGSASSGSERGIEAEESVEDQWVETLIETYETGNEDSPRWVFRARTKHKALRGSVPKNLTTLQALGFPWMLEGRIRTSLAGLSICEVDQLDTSPRKMKTLELRLRKELYFVAEHYLSRVNLSHGLR